MFNDFFAGYFKLISMKCIVLTYFWPCREQEENANVKKHRPMDKSDASAIEDHIHKLGRSLKSVTVGKLKKFYFQVIKPHGSRNVAARFCQLGPTLEEAKQIL